MKIDSILLPYQKKWVSDTASVKFYEKSRRIGVTWAEALDNVLTACSNKGMDVWYIGYNKDMAREYIDTCADWAKKLNQTASNIYDNEIIDEDKKILSYSITFHSGYKITALSGRPSNLRGKQGKAVIDEAAFHDDLKETMKAALAFLIWGGKVAVISTHFGEDNIFNEYIEDIRKGRLNYSLHRTTFDDAIADGLYERVASITGRGTPKPSPVPTTPAFNEQNSRASRLILQQEKQFNKEKEEWIKSIYADYGDSADEELRCIPSKSGGAYFASFLVESCMQADIPIVRFNPPSNWQGTSEASPLSNFPRFQGAKSPHMSDDFANSLYSVDMRKRESYVEDFLHEEIDPLLKNLNINNRHFIGEDFARSADLSVFWILAENKDLTLSTPFIVELRNAPHKVQEQIAHYIIDRLPRFNGGGFDARGNGEYLAESCTERYGEDLIISVKASESFYLNAFPKLKAALEDKTITLPKSADILADFRSVKLVKGVPKIVERVNEKDSHLKRHGDSVIACLLGVYARSELGNYETVDYEKVNKIWNI